MSKSRCSILHHHSAQHQLLGPALIQDEDLRECIFKLGQLKGFMLYINNEGEEEAIRILQSILFMNPLESNLLKICELSSFYPTVWDKNWTINVITSTEYNRRILGNGNGIYPKLRHNYHFHISFDVMCSIHAHNVNICHKRIKLLNWINRITIKV